jgi:predicted dehydrogenase
MTIAIVGAGGMGVAHARAWSALGKQDAIAYVCTPHHGVLADAPNARAIDDLEIALRDPAVTIVSICSPTPTHREFATRALQAGKNVLLEKPVALTLGDALAIEQAGRESSGLLMVAHVVRFFAGYRLVADAVSRGSLRAPRSVRAQRIISPPATPWWYDESRSGGVVVDLGVHDFDQVNLLLGTPVTVRSTSSDRLGPVETTIEYAEGGIGQVLTFCSAPAEVPFATSIEVLGSEGLASYRYIGAAADAGSPGDAELSEFRSVTTTGAERVEIHDDEPYVRQAEYFLQCVEKGTAPERCPVPTATAALRVALAARQSLTHGGALVPVDEP